MIKKYIHENIIVRLKLADRIEVCEILYTDGKVRAVHTFHTKGIVQSIKVQIEGYKDSNFSIENVGANFQEGDTFTLMLNIDAELNRQ